MRVIRERLRCTVSITSLIFTVLLIASSPAAVNKASAMIIDLDGTAQIICEGISREAGIASDLYPDETLRLTSGTTTLLMLDNLEKIEIAAPAEILVQPDGLQPMAGSTMSRRGQEDLLVAGANLGVFAKAIGTAGVLRDTGHRTRPMPLEMPLKSKKRDKYLNDKVGSNEFRGQMRMKPGARRESVQQTMKLRESISSLSDKDTAPPGSALLSEAGAAPEYEKREEQKRSEPAVWVFNSFYDQAFMVFACEGAPGARSYLFAVYTGDKPVNYTRSLVPYVEVSKRDWKLAGRLSYTLKVRIVGAGNQLIGEKTTTFTVPDKQNFARLDQFFGKPPVVRGLLLEKSNMLREALYLYKTTAHLNPGMADGLTGRIRKLENQLNDR